MATILVQAPSCELIPGEPVRVPIVLRLDEPLKVRGIHATFHGAEETQATYTTYNAATKSTQTHTAIEHVDIVRSEFLLSGNERLGFWGNLADGFATLLGGGEHELLDAGEYPFEVEVQVPEGGRPTFVGGKCRVFYELAVQVDIPAARDVKAVQSFQVIDDSLAELPDPEPVRIRYPDDQSVGKLDEWFGPDVNVEVALAQNAYYEGDAIEGVFKIESSTSLQYSAIDVRLIATESTAAHGHNDSYTHLGNAVRLAGSGTIDGVYSQRFELPASSPGLKPVKGEFFTVECFVQIELDVPWAKDPKVRVPIRLA